MYDRWLKWLPYVTGVPGKKEMKGNRTIHLREYWPGIFHKLENIKFTESRSTINPMQD